MLNVLHAGQSFQVRFWDPLAISKKCKGGTMKEYSGKVFEILAKQKSVGKLYLPTISWKRITSTISPGSEMIIWVTAVWNFDWR